MKRLLSRLSLVMAVLHCDQTNIIFKQLLCQVNDALDLRVVNVWNLFHEIMLYVLPFFSKVLS